MGGAISMRKGGGIQWTRGTGDYTRLPPITNAKGTKMSRKKLKKGAVQDALMGMKMPEAAAVFPYTGMQSMAPATGVMRNVGSTVPANQVPSSVPGMTASLAGGETPFSIPAESGLDLTKKARKAVRKELNRRLAALSLLEERATLLRERQPNNPFALSALGIAARNKRRAQNTATEPEGSLAKAVASIDPAEVFASLRDVTRALGIEDSAARWEPQQLNALQQLRNIMGGQPSESLRGRVDPSAVVGGPAAVAGYSYKAAGDEIAQAEERVRKARETGRAELIAQAESDATQARFRAEALRTFGGGF